MNPWLALFSNGNKFLRDRAWPRFVIARYDGFSCNLCWNRGRSCDSSSFLFFFNFFFQNIIFIFFLILFLT